MFTLGDAIISWESKKQLTVALSTEAEYIAEGAKETFHRRNIFLELFDKDITIKMYTGNQRETCIKSRFFKIGRNT